jgi:hypothetical protein
MTIFRRYGSLLACVLICSAAGDLFPANMRSFVKFVRRQAPVVYGDSVKEVRVLQRTKFDIKAKAVVDVKELIRNPGSNPQQASIEYSSYDEKTPMLEGGPQYQLRPGVSVLIFANSLAPEFRLDTSCTATVRSCCSGLMRCAILSAGSL